MKWIAGLILVALVTGGAVPALGGPQVEEARAFALQALGSGYLGVRMRDVSAQDKNDFGLQREMGVVIESVEPDSPAAAAGLQELDVVLEYSGIPVQGTRQFQRLVAETPVNRNVDMKVWRARRAVDVQVQVGERKGRFRFGNEGTPLPDGQTFKFEMPDIQIPEFARGDAIRFHRLGRGPRLGISGSTLTGQMAEFMGVPGTSGVLIMEVQQDSPAQRAGLQAGDVITAVEGTAVTSPEELSEALKDGTVNLIVNRKGRQLTLAAELGEKAPRPASGAIRM